MVRPQGEQHRPNANGEAEASPDVGSEQYL